MLLDIFNWMRKKIYIINKHQFYFGQSFLFIFSLFVSFFLRENQFNWNLMIDKLLCAWFKIESIKWKKNRIENRFKGFRITSVALWLLLQLNLANASLASVHLVWVSLMRFNWVLLKRVKFPLIWQNPKIELFIKSH